MTLYDNPDKKVAADLTDLTATDDPPMNAIVGQGEGGDGRKFLPGLLTEEALAATHAGTAQKRRSRIGLRWQPGWAKWRLGRPRYRARTPKEHPRNALRKPPS